MLKVLVVDDDVDLLEMVCQMLGSPSIQPVCIDNGSELLPTIEQFQPDVVVMDIYLGCFDGRNLCKQLKTDDQYAAIPVLLYSAIRIPAQSIEAAGADAFIQKPFEMSDLIQQVLALARRA